MRHILGQGVPTHWHKTVLLRLPNGEYKTFAYMIPNTNTLPTDKPGMTKRVRISNLGAE